MAIELQKGVTLHVIPTEKYKTTRVYLRFTTRLEQETVTKRVLLTSLLETNSLHYPDQTQLSSKLAEMYGAGFGLTVGKKGNLHWVNVGLSLVNDKYLGTSDLLAEGIDFLKEILFYPNIQTGAFSQATFDLEKENLKSYLESIKEDKKNYAALELQKLYFDEHSQQFPSFGRVEDLEQETAESIAAYYKEMLAKDQLDIFVIGAVSEKEVLPLLQKLPFTPRDFSSPEIFYRQPVKNVIREKQEQDAVVQSKLDLAYTTDIYYGEAERFPLILFNGLFGGFPHSKLFLNVREKESLAYYASSSVDTFRGFLHVQTGIDGNNRNKVLRLIAQQLEDLRKGEFTEAEIQQTKTMLRNQYLLSLDSPQAVIETDYLNHWLPQTRLSDEEWLARLAEVTKEEIQKAAQAVRLQAVFFLDGGKAHE